MGADENKLDQILSEIQGMEIDHEQFADLNRMFAKVKKEIKIKSKIKSTVKVLNNTIAELSIDVNLLNQQNLRNNLIIAGIPFKKGENLKEIFVKLSKKLKVEITEERFEIRRFASKSDTNSGNILVELDNFSVKKNLLKNRKTKNILTSELGFNGKKSIVLFNQLTHHNLEILAEAKKLRTECNFKFIWFQNNQILARKEKKSRIFTLQTKNDIEKLILSQKGEPKETFFDSSEVN